MDRGGTCISTGGDLLLYSTSPRRLCPSTWHLKLDQPTRNPTPNFQSQTQMRPTHHNLHLQRFLPKPPPSRPPLRRPRRPAKRLRSSSNRPRRTCRLHSRRRTLPGRHSSRKPSGLAHDLEGPCLGRGARGPGRGDAVVCGGGGDGVIGSHLLEPGVDGGVRGRRSRGGGHGGWTCGGWCW